MRLSSGQANNSSKFIALLAAICVACILGLVAASHYSHGLWRQILGVGFGYALAICIFVIVGTSVGKSDSDDAKRR